MSTMCRHGVHGATITNSNQSHSLLDDLDSGMQRSRAWCGTPPILGVVNMVGTRNFTCYMGAL